VRLRYPCFAVLLAALLLSCVPKPKSSEPDAQALAVIGLANLKAATTLHVDGSFLSEQVDPKDGRRWNTIRATVSGDSHLPDESRASTTMSHYGMNYLIDDVTADGRAYSRDAMRPNWHEAARATFTNVVMHRILQTSPLHDVVDVDRLIVDGRQTRHLQYPAAAADATHMLELMSLDFDDCPLVNTSGTTDLWIRIDDSQIVRQLVKVSYEVDLSACLGTAPTSDRQFMEQSLDLRFSHHGEAAPKITAPPVGSP
jgi:hypothetical protein